jgi:ABC-type transport system involved in multi-copper enzyme maturation permease subunit
MIWLTWRQSRTQTLIAVAVLAALAIYLLILGTGIHNFYDSQIAGCKADNSCQTANELFRNKYGDQVTLIGALLIGVPGLIGIFWGAPLITRELETGTNKLVWNQSVTRTRWLGIKLVFIALTSLAITGVLTLLLGWAVGPFDKVIGSRFSAMTFDSRDIVPIGYAVFAFALGTTVGLLIRRTLPAMAVTLAVFAAVQIVMPLAIRPHLISPITANVAFTTEVAQTGINGLGSNGGPGSGGNAPVGVFGYNKPGAWILGSPMNRLIKADGQAFTQGDMKTCMTGDFNNDLACLAKQNLHFSVTYQPGSRYWPFQWIESSIFLALALALAGVCFWRIPRVS